MIERQFFAESSLENFPSFSAIRDRYPAIQWIDDYQHFRKKTMHAEKQCVIFARKRGEWLKPFFCYHQNREFRYYSLDLAEGCFFDCVYCYLQTYLNHGALVIFLNHDSVQQEIQRLSAEAERPLWISTGLLSDSLLAESIFPVVETIAECVPVRSVLELRSKTTVLDSIRANTIPRDRVVLSWSLNPPSIAQNFEYGAAPLEERLGAAKEAMALGYRIGFHLDPVFYYDDWEKEYGELLKTLSLFPKSKIAFLSLGIFRYMPDLGKKIRSRFPYHSVLTGEFFLDRDGKYHYFRVIRKEMYQAFKRLLKPLEGVPVFWSMEPDGRLFNAK